MRVVISLSFIISSLFILGTAQQVIELTSNHEIHSFSGSDFRSHITGVLRIDPSTGSSSFVSQLSWEKVVAKRIAFYPPTPSSSRLTKSKKNRDAELDLAVQDLPFDDITPRVQDDALLSLGDRNYSADASAMYARFAAASYCVATAKGLEAWNCKACKELPKTEKVRLFSAKNTSTHAYVGYVPSANIVIVSFAGTDPFNIKNWITDLVFAKVDYSHCSKCQVHLGFHEAYRSVRVGIAGYVAELLRAHPGSAVAITGHSLGAALAHLALVDLAQAGLPIAFPTYVFGSPRLGNSEFAAYLYSAFRPYGMYRIVHWKDPVCQLPQTFLGFQHAPLEVWYEAGESKYKVCAMNTGEDKSCSHSDNLLPWLPDLIYHQQYGKFDYISNYLACKL